MTTAPLSARRAQTRQRLLDAATAVFAQRGVPASSVEEICEAAGFTRGAFYSNFASKDELCIALLTEFARRDMEAATATIEGLDPEAIEAGDVEELVLTGVRAFVALQDADRDRILVNAELRLHAARTPEIRDAYTAFCDDDAVPFASLMTPVLERHGYRWRLPEERALALLRAVWEESLMQQLLRPSPLRKEDLEANLVVLLRALTEPIPRS